MGDLSLSGVTLGLVGAGKMAEALIRGALAASALGADRVIASDPDPARRDAIAALGVRTTPDNAEVMAAAGAVVLAVKPQVMARALESIAPHATREHLFISIAAGYRISKIESALPRGSRVVRVMPNLTMQVGHGATAVSRGSSATDVDMRVALALFATSGKSMEVAERDLDAVTAVSGSGPAYAFFLAECMIEAGVAEGLAPGVARSLVAATIEGAGVHLALAREDAAELRRRVTSPGGTTEAAFAVLQKAGVRDLMVEAIRRAAARSRELSGT